MANNFATNPWTLDSVMAAPYTGYVKINDISWDSQVALGDRLVINDQHGNTIVDIKASAPDVIERLGRIGWVNGLQVVQIDSGKVIIAV